MKHNLSILLFTVFSLLLFRSNSSGQKPHVGYLTGSLNMSKELYMIQMEGKNFPISANYHTSGMKVGMTGGLLGLGWNLSISGAIRRSVNKIPDDHNSSTLKGWLHTNVQEITALKAALDGQQCLNTFDNTQNLELKSNISKKTIIDIPDEFHVDFPGISGTIIFDQFGEPHFQENNGYTIHATFEGNDGDGLNFGQIQSFQIIDNEGFVYDFLDKAITAQISGSGDNIGLANFPSFENSTIDDAATFTNAWHLTKITSPAGERIEFTYDDESASPVLKHFESSYSNLHFTKKPDSNEYDFEETGRVKQWAYPKYLREIEVFRKFSADYTEKVVLEGFYKRPESLISSYNVNSGNDGSFIKSIKKLSYLKVYKQLNGKSSLLLNYKFNYHPEQFGPVYFLKSIASIKGNSYVKPVEYDYHLIKDSPITIEGNERDHWGYFSDNDFGSNSGPHPPQLYLLYKQVDPDRGYNISNFEFQFSLNKPTNWSYNSVELDGWGAHNPDKISFGSINAINYPDGAYVAINYEPNQYYDESFGENFYGGGVRVKDITEFNTRTDASLNATELDYKPNRFEYIYEDATGISSGRPVNMPHYGIPLQFYKDPVTGDRKFFEDILAGQEGEVKDVGAAFEMLIKRSSYDLDQNNQNYTAYNKVVEVIQGRGKMVYEYENKGVIGSSSAFYEEPFADFHQFVSTVNGSCESLGMLESNNVNKYPFTPTFNQNIGNNLLKTSWTYDNDGNLLNSVHYTYQFTPVGSSSKVVAYQIIDHSEGANQYSLYSLGEYGIFVDVSRKVQSIETITYDLTDVSKHYKVLKRLNFDDELNFLKSEEVEKGQLTEQTFYTYPDDYDLVGVDVSNEESFGHAIARLQQSGIKSRIVESKKTLKKQSGEISTVSGAINDFKVYNGYVQPAHRLSFNEIINRDFINSTIDANGNLGHDIAYQKGQTYHDFIHDRFLSSADRSGNFNSVHFDESYAVPVLQISGAKASQVIYSDFESDKDFQFTYQGIVQEGVGNKFISLGSNEEIHSQPYAIGEELDFVLSFRFKCSSSTNLTFTVKNSNESVVHNENLSLGVSAGGWVYKELAFGLSGPNPEGVTFHLNADTAMDMDEILIRPKGSYVNNFKYNDQFQLVEATDNDGKKVFKEYDEFNRVIFQKDNKGNIVQTHQYHLPVDNVLNPDFSFQRISKDIATYKFTAIRHDELISYYWKANNEEEIKGDRDFTYTFHLVSPDDDPDPENKVRLRLVHPAYGEAIKTVILENVH